MIVNPLDLPFDEAIAYFRQKGVNLPTKTWADLWEGMHSKAFVVAGATKSGLLSDLRSAVDSAISKGTTLADFRKSFDAAVNKAGWWDFNGEYGWRTGTIFNTNVSVAYAAGRWKQMTDPDVLAAFPYWRYRTQGDGHVRPLHASWDNVVLLASDPWWQTHYPPNGWG